MAVLIYSNGIVEDYRPSKLVFSEEEIISFFEEYTNIITCRIISPVNSWCVYGDNQNINTIEDLNKIASIVAKQSIFSHPMFIHDSELNPDWKVSDEILYNSYEKFDKDIKSILDDAAIQILNEFDAYVESSEKSYYLPELIPLGKTDDKKIMFLFNPDEQPKEFYNNDNFYNFSKKVYTYLTVNKQAKPPFTIYSDKRAIIIIDTTKVKNFLGTLIEKFKNNEEYEICENITKMIKQWSKYDKEIKPKAKRRSRSSEDKQNE